MESQAILLEKDEIKIGVTCIGNVARIMSYGAFVEISAGKDGLCHISEFSTARIERLESIIQVGDPLEVMILNIDDQDRIDLSHRAVAMNETFEVAKERRDSARKKSSNRGNSRNFGGGGNRGGYGGSRDSRNFGGGGNRGGYGGSRDRDNFGEGGRGRGGYRGSRDRDNFGGGGRGRGGYGGGRRNNDGNRGR
ncbi:MAG: hypothetical protein CL780_01875 [Chloroflexi bacterium]|nr:hypothetical protein [Chloroflexota bacterium]|tara:strand:+ start:645 stop:1226 length:582 start_codon:yes stop_codon:yes gene_type:complete